MLIKRKDGTFTLNEHSLQMKGEDKRALILKATMELITEHGFHATPMSMIARHAGVAAGTIYNYFPSKEVLINQLYADLKQKMGAALLQNYEESGNLRDRFFRFYRNLFQYFVEKPEEFMFLEQFANSPLVTQLVGEGNTQIYGPITDFLAGGIEVGILRGMEIELMTALVYGHVVAVAKLHLSEELSISEDRLAQAVQSCWDSVKIT